MYIEGFTYSDWYVMPVYLRSYYVDVVVKERVKQQHASNLDK